jgi:hypothetical protein
MYYYIPIKRLNGRHDYYRLADLLEKYGYDDRVEYFVGDYNSTEGVVLPHLRFTNEGDAVAYCLRNGSTMTTKIPTNTLTN